MVHWKSATPNAFEAVPMHNAPSLLIPDVHQDSEFLESALYAGQSVGVREVILMGDLLDGRKSRTRSSFSASRTLSIVEDLILGQQVPTVLLWGNHDFKYWKHRDNVSILAECPDAASFVETAFLELSLNTLHALAGSRHSRRRYSRLGTIWGRHAQLALFRHGHVISHAGIDVEFWPGKPDPGENVAMLNQEMRAIQNHPSHRDPSGLTEPGLARMGNRRVGGPLWLDWDEEFTDALSVPQIVGHTPCPDGPRQIGRSWCLDGAQRCFALLYPDGAMEPRML